jgi:hypothetical protein
MLLQRLFLKEAKAKVGDVDARALPKGLKRKKEANCTNICSLSL